MTEGAVGEGTRPVRYDGRVIVDARHAQAFDEAMFDPLYWQRLEAVTDTAGGRGRVLFVAAGEEQWVLRHYHRGGMMTPALGDLYLWTGAARTRSMSEFRLLAALHDEGFPVPRPVAARYNREGIFYRADLITVCIPEARSLAAIATRAMPEEPLWRAIGACIKRFHDAGVFHADLNAHNIVLDARQDVFLVDFDRGRKRQGEAWKRSNLRRLNRSLHKIGLSLTEPEFEQRQWRALTEGYESA